MQWKRRFWDANDSVCNSSELSQFHNWPDEGKVYFTSLFSVKKDDYLTAFVVLCLAWCADGLLR